ncbi:gluconokinase [Nocardia sp. CC201C]|uniref:gluconokinase n=1 Tax=Nocardia sp. CC201C TaxID=3044575 RepID=UPI0024A8C61A|nr:gluconokinase [Nocardia sp. CC201C]
MTAQAPQIVVMGVAGSGKTTVGTLLAHALGVEYGEGDDFHPEANVAKMASGVPLDDTDRAPWLDALAGWLADRRSTGAVLTCSALKQSYRDRLRTAAPDLFFVHLAAPRDELERRLTSRKGHFMGARMLDSQLAVLRPLTDDESGITLDATLPPADLVEQIRTALPTTVA